MLQLNNLERGGNMEYVEILDLDKSIYETIYRVFSDKNQADAIASIFEKVLIQANTATRRLIEEKKYEILEAVKQELDRRNYATKSDLEAGLANLELKLMNEIGKIRVEIAEVRTEIAEVRTEIIGMIKDTQKQVATLATNVEIMQKGLDDKINSFKFYIIKWIAGIAFTSIVAVSGIIKFL